MHEPYTLPVDDRFEVRINHFLPATGNHLFNDLAYFRLHATSPRDVYAQLARRSDGEVHATFVCYEGDSNEYHSPKRGTFGGLSAKRGIEFLVVERFLGAVVEHLRSIGARTLHVKGAPFSHDLPLSSMTANFLLRSGGTMTGFDLNYDLEVDDRPFHARIDAGSRKRIRRCNDEGFQAAEVLPDDGLRVYNLIRLNRERRGFPITMSANQLDDMASAFPGRIRYFAVYLDASRVKMAAGAVCMSLSPEVLYVFYWGDGDGMQSYSPVALLAETIYVFAQREGYRILDAGTSTSAGSPNHGLIAFKRGLGFSESLKPSYVVPLQP